MSNKPLPVSEKDEMGTSDFFDKMTFKIILPP